MTAGTLGASFRSIRFAATLFRWRTKGVALSCAAMTYDEFRDRIQRQLVRHPDGLTWRELQTQLRLPYDRPCPTWVNELEREIGLRRASGSGRAHVWTLEGRGTA